MPARDMTALTPRPAGEGAKALMVPQLRWQRPAEVTDYQTEGLQRASLVAPGWAGVYSIDETKGGCFLWWAHDGFSFRAGFATIEEAKAAAEADWQARIHALLSRAATVSR